MPGNPFHITSSPSLQAGKTIGRNKVLAFVFAYLTRRPTTIAKKAPRNISCKHARLSSRPFRDYALLLLPLLLQSTIPPLPIVRSSNETLQDRNVSSILQSHRITHDATLRTTTSSCGYFSLDYLPSSLDRGCRTLVERGMERDHYSNQTMINCHDLSCRWIQWEPIYEPELALIPQL